MSLPRPSAGLVMFVCTCVWASTFAVTKELVATAPPLLYLTLRFGAAAVLLAPLLLWRRGALRRPGFLRDSLVLGLLNAGGLIFQVLGQVYTTASKSAFITSLNTPLTALVGLVVYRIVPTVGQRIAIALASFGLVLLTWPHDGAALNPGDLLTVVCAILYGFFITESARRAPRHDSVALTVSQILVGVGLFALCLGATAYVRAHVAELDWPAIVRLEARPFPRGPRVAAEMAYMAIVCVVLVMLAQTWALQRLTAATAAVIFALEPVLATAIAIAIAAQGASEWPGPRGAAGGMMVLFAVYAAEGKALRRRLTATTANSRNAAGSGDDPEERPDISQP